MILYNDPNDKEVESNTPPKFPDETDEREDPISKGLD